MNNSQSNGEFKDFDGNIAQILGKYQQSLLNGCDYNRDKKISKAELKMILFAFSRSADS